MNEGEIRECLSCKGVGSKIGLVECKDGHLRQGLATCRRCKGTGKLTEAKYQKCKEFWDSLPTEEEADQLIEEENHGEKWKLQ